MLMGRMFLSQAHTAELRYDINTRRKPYLSASVSAILAHLSSKKVAHGFCAIVAGYGGVVTPPDGT